MVFAFVSNAFAGLDVVVKNGSYNELLDKNLEIAVEWDYTNSTIEDKDVNTFLHEKGADWERDYPKELEHSEDCFIAKFNKDTKWFKVNDHATDAEYKMVIVVKNYHYGSTGASVAFGFGVGDSTLEGKVLVYKKGESKPVVDILIEGVHGGGMGNEARRVNCYEELAKQLTKLMKKAM